MSGTPGPATVTGESAVTVDDGAPTVEEAMARLAGRRALAIELQAHVVVVKETRGQNRRTRRNNLRVDRAKTRREKAT